MPALVLQSLPYARDSSELIRRIGALPGAACLDSGLGDQREGRFDILTALPSRELRLHNDRVESRDAGNRDWQARRNDNDIFSTADVLLRDSPPEPDTLAALQHLPFCGGLICCFSYDAATPTEACQRSEMKQGALADILYRVPLATAGLYHWAVVVDHVAGSSVLFVLPQCPGDVRQRVVHDLLPALMNQANLEPASVRADFSLLQAFAPQLDDAAYKQAFARLKEWIYAGDCYQANLAIPFVAACEGDTLSAYLRLRQGSRSPFSAWIRQDEFQVLSLSPERFISVVDGEVVTQPIKGTRKRSANAAEDLRLAEELLSSDKDRAENLMIVDLLRNDLGRVCETGSVKTRALFELHSFSQVHHLISTVTGTLPASTSPLALLKSCFPGGSITGAPKIRAMEIIAELEPLPRSVYCGSVMYCDYRGRLDSNIAIRTLLSTEGHLFCWGGGGIVADSVADREHQEARDKVSALMELVSGQAD